MTFEHLMLLFNEKLNFDQTFKDDIIENVSCIYNLDYSIDFLLIKFDDPPNMQKLFICLQLIY